MRRRQTGRAVLLAALLGLVGIIPIGAAAQDPVGGPLPDPRGESANGLSFTASDGNEILLWSASISGSGLVAKNQHVSGTKAEFDVQVGICLAVPPLQPNGAAVLNDSAYPTQITNYKVEIQTPQGSWETVDTQQGPFRLFPKETGPSPMPATNLRVATTAYQHDNPIRIKVSYDVSYYKKVNGIVVGPIEPERFEHEFPFEAYNEMQVASTVVAEFFQQNPPADPLISFQYRTEFENVGGNVVGRAISAANALNHLPLPGSIAAAASQQAPTIIGGIAPATAAIFCLHGHNNVLIGGWSYDFLADTDGWTAADWNTPYHSAAAANAIKSTQIAGEVSNKATNRTPAYNLVFLYSCHMVDSWGSTVSSTGFPAAYGIKMNPLSVGRAFLGFSTSIDLYCWTAEDWQAATAEGKSDPYKLDPRLLRLNRVNDHAKVFLERIVAGDIVEVAANEADSQYPMCYGDGPGSDEYQKTWHRTQTLIVGDGYTRLRYVYLNAQERRFLPGDAGNRVWVKLPVGQ